MIIKIKDADFSANNIGNVPVSELSQFTLNAIAASGNSLLTNTQKSALEDFFTTIGATTNSALWGKIKYVWLPMLAGELSKALVNYKDNTVSVTPNSSWKLENNGILWADSEVIPTTLSFTETSSITNLRDLSVFYLHNDYLTNNVYSITFGTKNAIRTSIYLSKTSIGGITLAILGLSGTSFSVGDLNFSAANDKFRCVLARINGSNFTYNTQQGYDLATEPLKNNDLFPDTTQETELPIQPFHFFGTKQAQNVPSSLLIVGSAMTDEELVTVARAVNTLKLYFGIGE